MPPPPPPAPLHAPGVVVHNYFEAPPIACLHTTTPRHRRTIGWRPQFGVRLHLFPLAASSANLHQALSADRWQLLTGLSLQYVVEDLDEVRPGLCRRPAHQARPGLSIRSSFFSSPPQGQGLLMAPHWGDRRRLGAGATNGYSIFFDGGSPPPPLMDSPGMERNFLQLSAAALFQVPKLLSFGCRLAAEVCAKLLALVRPTRPTPEHSTPVTQQGAQASRDQGAGGTPG